jgi:hypothetical protein
VSFSSQNLSTVVKPDEVGVKKNEEVLARGRHPPGTTQMHSKLSLEISLNILRCGRHGKLIAA